ncbi:MAG TPA: hypothetical protein VK208_07760 [Pyrinomonadaceae bacterium]|nr:hypothetical protein [Pyrinomonadaceae bacterium]
MRKVTVGGSELAAGGTTKFVYDGSDVIRDLDGTGSTIATTSMALVLTTS